MTPPSMLSAVMANKMVAIHRSASQGEPAVSPSAAHPKMIIVMSRQMVAKGVGERVERPQLLWKIPAEPTASFYRMAPGYMRTTGMGQALQVGMHQSSFIAEVAVSVLMAVRVMPKVATELAAMAVSH